MTIEIKEKSVCPICHSNSSLWDDVKYTSSRSSKKNGTLFHIYKCNLCGHGFLLPSLKSREELIHFYDKNYAKNYNPDIERDLFKLRKKQYRLDIDLVNKYVPKDKISVLDFGCSTGQFLKIMPSNWKKYGFEVNKFELDYIAKNYKDIIIFSEISQIKDLNFNLITLRGVIEHLYDFNDLFLVINENLKEKGIIYVCATPDFNSPCSIIYKSHWNQISVPYHYHQFTVTSISILFAKNGFGLKALYYPYIETPYADFLSDAYKFITNIKRFFENKNPIDFVHAFPGNMMSLIFEKMRILK